MHYLKIKPLTLVFLAPCCLNCRSPEISETQCFCLHFLHSMADVSEMKRDDATTLKEIFLLLTQSSESRASDLRDSSPPPDIHSSSAPPNTNIVSESTRPSPPPVIQSAPPSIHHSSPPSSSCSSSVCLDHDSSITLTDRCVQHLSSTQLHYVKFMWLQDPKKLCFLCWCTVFPFKKGSWGSSYCWSGPFFKFGLWHVWQNCTTRKKFFFSFSLSP